MTDRFAPLRARFRERVKADLDRLRGLRTENLDSEDLQRLVHNTAGAAGTFGFVDLSEAAMAVDDRYAVGDLPEAARLDALERAMVEVAETD